MKQIIFFIVSVIVFIGCEAEKKKVTKISGASSSSNFVESNVANQRGTISETATVQTLKMVAVPVIKNGDCPGFYISPRNKYCIPVEGAPAIYPRQRGFPCPSGWSPQFSYCVAGPNAAAIISQSSACPEGWSPQHKYCLAGKNATAIISRNRGFPCPPGWSPEHRYCVASPDATSVVHKRKDYYCPLGWSEQNEYCLK